MDFIVENEIETRKERCIDEIVSIFSKCGANYELFILRNKLEEYYQGFMSLIYATVLTDDKNLSIIAAKMQLKIIPFSSIHLDRMTEQILAEKFGIYSRNYLSCILHETKGYKLTIASTQPFK